VVVHIPVIKEKIEFLVAERMALWVGRKQALVSKSDPTSIAGKRIHHHLLSTKYTPLFIVATNAKKEKRKKKG